MNLQQQVVKAIETDASAHPDHSSAQLKATYEGTTEDGRALLDSAFISLCGYSLKTLIEKGVEDMIETGHEFIYERKLRITINLSDEYERDNNNLGTFDIETTDLPEVSASGRMSNNPVSGNFEIEFDDTDEEEDIIQQFDIYNTLSSMSIQDVIEMFYIQSVSPKH